MDVIKPITPNKAHSQAIEQLPDVVIQAMNTLITNNWNGSSSRVKTKELWQEIDRINETEEEIEFFTSLLIQKYKDAGWKVKHDAPVYYGGENFDAYYEFSK